MSWRPHAPTCAVWFLFFSGMGLLFPYNSLYLRENAGLPPFQVGLILAVPPLVALVAQPVWGQVADRTGARARILVVLCAGSAASLVLFSQLEGFWPLAAGLALVAVFYTSVVPGLTSVSLATLSEIGRTSSFGRYRIWGTLGFLCTVALFPVALHALQDALGWKPGAAPGAVDGVLVSEPGLELMFLVAAAANLLAVGFALRLPRAGAVGIRAAPGEWRRLLAHPPYRRLLAVVFAGFLFLHGPMVLLPLWVRSLGGGLGTVSGMWLVMLSLEVPLTLAAGHVLKRFDPRALVLAGIAAGGLRWIGCGLWSDPFVLHALQLLHGAVVVGLLMGAALYVDAAVPPQLRSTAQALLTMTGAGLGGIVSSVLAGLAVEELGARAPYLVGGVGACVLAVLGALLLPRPERPERPDVGGSPAEPG